MPPDRPVVIVGGGVSGLACAYFLGQAGVRSLLFEKAPRLGGLIRTDHVQGCVLEAGPDSFLAAKPAVTELSAEIPALQGELIGSNDSARRIFVARSGELVPVPAGMVLMVPGRWGPVLGSSLFSFGTKVRLVAEVFRRPQKRTQDVSVARFVTDHFGQQMLDSLAEPLLAGVYGGDSNELSARAVLPRFSEYEASHGSLIRAVRRERRSSPQAAIFRSFRGGMQCLTDALAEAAAPFSTVLHAAVHRVERTGGQSWRVRTGQQSYEASHVILACPAYESASLLKELATGAATQLGEISYSSAILCNFVYERSDLGHPLDGFGFLVPRKERRTIAAATWVSTKFPSRTPADLAAIRAFIVGKQAGELMRAADGEIAALVESDLAQFMGIRAAPQFRTVQRWPRSMPQYVVGHQARVERIEAEIGALPGIHLVGNAFHGVGIPDCVRLAKERAKMILGR